MPRPADRRRHRRGGSDRLHVQPGGRRAQAVTSADSAPARRSGRVPAGDRSSSRRASGHALGSGARRDGGRPRAAGRADRIERRPGWSYTCSIRWYDVGRDRHDDSKLPNLGRGRSKSSVASDGMAPRKTAVPSGPTINVRGAREHNLKNVNVELPRDKLVVFTGLSGSGKSSLAFDTIYAEGQRRYVESLSCLRPPVPRARWTSPTSTSSRGCRRRSRSTRSRRAATHGRRSARSPRSTTTCGCCTPASASSTARTTARGCSARRPSRSSTASSRCPRARDSRCSPRSCAVARASTTRCSRTSSGQGYVRARIDGETVDIDEFLKRDERLARYEQHKIEVVVDRLVLPRGHRAPADRLARDRAATRRRRRRVRDRQRRRASRRR